MKKEEKNLPIPEVKFAGKHAEEFLISAVLTPDDYWTHRKDTWILSHVGVEKIAKASGIKPQINTRFIIEVQPTIQNAMNHQLVAEMVCTADADPEDPEKCIHGSDKKFFSTGEASRMNTGARGGQYLRIMAEKRAYDRGVLRHLGLDSNINIYSEEEAEAFDKEPMKGKISDESIVKLQDLINGILNAMDKETLKQVGIQIKEANITDEMELDFLRDQYKQRLASLSEVEF